MLCGKWHFGLTRKYDEDIFCNTESGKMSRCGLQLTYYIENVKKDVSFVRGIGSRSFSVKEMCDHL